MRTMAGACASRFDSPPLPSRIPRSARRDARVAEGGALLRRYTGKTRIEGSNPSLSANFFLGSRLAARARRLVQEHGDVDAHEHPAAHESRARRELNTASSSMERKWLDARPRAARLPLERP